MTEQRTPAWYEQRKGRVTGSAVGAILGLAPYATRADILRRMVRDYHGAPSEFTGNVATSYGTENEDGAVWQYELETGNKVVPAGFVPFEDWLGASPDGYIGADGLIEVKCPYSLRNGGEFKSIQDQPHYYAQIQVQLYCTGMDWCDFYQWAPHGTKLERVDLDRDWLDRHLPILRQFYAEYLSELDNTDHIQPLRKELNTLEAKRVLEEIDQLREAEEQAKERRKELEADLVLMAGNQNANIWGRKLTLVEKEGSISYAKVVKDHCPTVDLEVYRGKPSSYWRLT
jgi:putative phage-type endonuclease